MRKILIWGFLMSLLVAVPGAWAVKTVSDAPLPAWETEEEKALRAKYGFPNPMDVDTPPTGNVESYTEWAPADGVIIAWMAFSDYLTELTREFVQNGTCWIVVESAAQQNTVSNTLTSAGVSLDNVEFLIFNMDSVWMVDYGPFFINVDGNREITDQIYDRYSRWEDDAFPGRLGTAWSIPTYTSDLRIEGGNFYTDGLGTCFITERAIEQNAGYLTEQQVYERLEDYCGCETVHVLDKLNDGTGHIDMFFKLLDVDTILLGQYDPGDPEYTTLENNATFLASLTSSIGTPYEIIRIPMPGTPSAYWTYTNSLIVNDIVYVPTYNVSGDAAALAIYESAMPGYTAVGIDCSGVIGSGGAIHCTTKVVPTAAEYSAGLTSVVIDDAAGDADGMLDPGETVYLQITLRNSGVQVLQNVSGVLSCDLPGSVTIPDDEASWPDIDPGTSALSLSPHFLIVTDAAIPEGTEIGFTLDLTATSYTDTKAFSLTATRQGLVYSWNLDTNPGWTVEDQWAWGVPLGNNGDPTSGYTGTNVYGYNLSGNYANSLPERSLTSTAIDCSELVNVEVRFMRWLGVESAQWDHAAFKVSSNGSTWTTIWEHTGSNLIDTSWQSMAYDISAVADGQSSVYLRWIMGTTDSSVAYCGWNIDDIEIWGASTIVPPTPTPGTPTPTEPPNCVHHGDVNFSGDLTASDAQMTFLIALGSITPTYEEGCAADCNHDGSVTAGDAQAVFLAVLGLGTCADPI